MSLPSYIEQLLLNPNVFMVFFFTVGVSFCLVNKLIFGTYLCGLATLQFPTIIVTTVVIDLYTRDLVDFQRLLHFIVVEGLLYILVLVFYRNILKIPNIALYFIKFYEKYSYIVIVPAVIFCLINLYNVGGQGSRIYFQTSYWYSFIRPIFTLFMPLLMLGIFVNIFRKRYLVGLSFTALALIISISAGSKGAFIIAMVGWYLIYRDIFGNSLLKVNAKSISFCLMCIAGAYLNLSAVNVDLVGVLTRIISYGDATFLIYQADNPTLACADQSVMSLSHRGVARLIGDPAAIDPSTLFGFSVSQIFYGGHNFTGPNARIGAYTLCAFPGIGASYMFFLFFVYLTILKSMVYLKVRGIPRYKLSSLFLPFVISSLTASLMDYNRVMSDVTFVLMMYVLVIFYLFIPKRRVYHQL
jgi:hypothetical protein